MFHSKMIRQFEVFLQSLPSRVHVTPASGVSVPWQSFDSLQQRNINTLTQRMSADSSCNLSTVFSDDDVCIVFVQSTTPESLVPSTVTSVDCPVLICASGVREVEYGTIPIHQIEEAQMSMCCRMHLDMAWLHLFSLEIAHPTIPRGVSTTATSMSSPEAQFRFASQIQSQHLDLFLGRPDSSFSRVCLTVMSRCSFQHH